MVIYSSVCHSFCSLDVDSVQCCLKFSSIGPRCWFMDGIAEGDLSSVEGAWILLKKKKKKPRMQYDEGCSKSGDSVSSGLKSQGLGRIMGVSVRAEDTQPRTLLARIHEECCACVPGVCRLHALLLLQ